MQVLKRPAANVKRPSAELQQPAVGVLEGRVSRKTVTGFGAILRRPAADGVGEA